MRPYLRLVLEVLSIRYIIKMQKIADPNNLCQIVYKLVTKKYCISLAFVIIKLNSSWNISSGNLPKIREADINRVCDKSTCKSSFDDSCESIFLIHVWMGDWKVETQFAWWTVFVRQTSSRTALAITRSISSRLGDMLLPSLILLTEIYPPYTEFSSSNQIKKVFVCVNFYNCCLYREPAKRLFFLCIQFGSEA